jgi:two-component system, OmpR family, phosphate regulon sensor histidine kinase PhoR
MRYNLKLLVVITGMAILGIIVLQVFWLQNAYREQKDRFATDVENAVTEARVNSLLAAALQLKLTDSSLNGQVKDTIKLSIINIPDTSDSVTARRLMQMTKSPDSLLAYTKELIAESFTGAQKTHDNLFSAQTSANSKLEPFNLRAFRNVLEDALKKRSISIPFGVAIIDNNKIQNCTIDTNSFRRAAIKSTPASVLPLVNGSIQLAFPDANSYIIRKIAWILFTSVVLIILCCVSFSVMVTMFFRQKKISEIKNDFMSNMTHELKTPLSSVSVALQLMQDKDITELQRAEFYQVAENEVSRLNMLIDKVMKMAAFEKNAIKINKENTALQPLIQRTIQAFSPILKKQNAQIHLQVIPDDLELYIDKVHFTNVIHNLIDNALKYNDKQTPQIDISATEQNGFVTLLIQDNGKGIPDAYINRIFEKFFRVPQGNLHETKGYGLGLSYVKAIIDLHAGTISVGSKPGAGTMFTIQLPKTNH